MQSITQIATRPFALSLAIGLLASLFLAIMSKISCPLPFTPVPFTMQTMGLFILAAVLGKAHAVRAVLCYLLEGTIGMPVFASSTPCWYLEPSAGFLLSFIAAAYIIGKLPKKNLLQILVSLALGQLVIFTIGASWLAFFVGIGSGIKLGVLPFLYGAIVKIVASSLVIRGYQLCRQ